MDKEIRRSADGAPRDVGGHRLAEPLDLAQFKHAADLRARMITPVLLSLSNENERLFVAAFDGTGNNKYVDPFHATNVAAVADQVAALNDSGNSRIYAHYVVGPGSQASRVVAGWDLARGFSYEDNIRSAYEALVTRVDAWKEQNPDVEVRVQSIGFSRGASQAAGFTRLLHENGLPDPNSESIDSAGRSTYSRYHVQPGQVIQTVGLLDPVATGVPMNFDRRLPPSVVSGLQITARDEQRYLFPSDQIIPPGLSDDGRFLNVTVPGAHSDVGGGYGRNGLSTRSGNLFIDYLNSASDAPFLKKSFEPVDPRLNVIHRSNEGMLLYRLDPRVALRGEPGGTNNRLAPYNIHSGPLPHLPEPTDKSLLAQLAHARSAGTPAPLTSPHAPLPPVSREVMLEAARSVSVAPAAMRTLGVAAAAHDAYESFSRQSELRDQGNVTAANADIVRVVGRNAAGWAGAEMFAGAGAVAGVESGPGLLVTAAVGGIIGFTAGDKVADAYDRHRIDNQNDAQGISWHRDPERPDQGWTRDVPALPDAPAHRLVADAPLSSRLSYQASNTAVELALAHPATPQDPYRQPAVPSDTRSLRDASWSRDPATHTWSREVTTGVLEHGMINAHREAATLARSEQLERAAASVVRSNVAQAPHGIAREYEAMYAERGWAEHGPIPDAVQHFARETDDRQLASDGHAYTRSADGEWTRPGVVFGRNAADPGVGTELDAMQRADIAARQDSTTAGVSAVPARLDDPAHPDHALFGQAQAHLREYDASVGRVSDQYTDNLASALVVNARSDGLERIDQVAMSDDGSKLWAVQTPPGRTDHLFDLRTNVDTTQATTSMETSAAAWPQAMAQHQQANAAIQAIAPALHEQSAHAPMMVR